jgi:signal transduction histidine kinase/ligand-binding sensor domain-containing protein
MSQLHLKRVLLFLFLFLFFELHAVIDYEFQIDKRIILQEGLSQSRILSVLEDERGFMWFGTADGLNRYDGYTFKIFRSIFNDSTSLPNNVINSMVEDNDGNIWIGTNNGVVIFNPYLETFRSLRETDSTAIAFGANLISSCVIDKQNNIWYSTQGYGIFKVNHKTFEQEVFLLNETDSLQLLYINNLYIDSFNRLWIGGLTNNIVFALNVYNGKVEKYHIKGFADTDHMSIIISSFFEDNDNRIWMSCNDFDGKKGGVFFLDDGQTSFNSYWQFVSKKFHNSYYDFFCTITSITGDDAGNIWAASHHGGVFKIKFGNTPIAYFNQYLIKHVGVNCIYWDSRGMIWIGTNGYGIEISIPDKTDFKLMSNKLNSDFSIESIRAFAEDDNYYWVGGYYGLSKIKKDFSELKTFHSASVYAIANYTNNSNLMWTGSEGGGLMPLNKVNNTLSNIKFNHGEVNQNSLRNIYVIFPLNDTLLLLGTLEGLFGYNPVSKIITPYPYFNSISKKLISKTVRTIYMDNWGNILIGYVQGGIGKLKFKTKIVERFNIIPELQSLNIYNPINCIYNDKKNRYWIATSNGLFMHGSGDEKTRLFTEADGLPNSHIYAILPDDEDNLWLSTNNGLSCYYPQEGIFRNYYVSDGLQNNEFNTGAYFKASNGTLFFGGIKGFNYFNPKKIKQNSIIPELVITEIKISNQYLKISKQELSQYSLTIQPNQEVFTIEFAGLSFINSNKNQYKYKIKELNQEWIQLDNQHHITFINLSPGTYTLEILASNNHGLWLKNPYTFTIVVLPTFFESVYFKWLIVVLTIILIIIGYRIRLKQLTKQKDRLQIFADQQTANLLITNQTLKNEIIKHKVTADELNGSNKTKDKFLSIMAHDIINPLGVIQGFSDLLTDNNNEFDEKDKLSFIQTINLTAKELTSLLSNLLQWSRLQSDSLTPKPQSITLKNIVLETATLLQGNIEKKEINLKISIDEGTKIIADNNMLSTILRNLLSNAVKFTPDKGQISIDSKHINDMIEVSITDNGVGISKENQNKLFIPDNNITTKGTNNESGTGLGLGLVYEFVIMNGGKIWVKSEIGKGTTFYFTLVVNKKGSDL